MQKKEAMSSALLSLAQKRRKGIKRQEGYAIKNTQAAKTEETSKDRRYHRPYLPLRESYETMRAYQERLDAWLAKKGSFFKRMTGRFKEEKEPPAREIFREYLAQEQSFASALKTNLHLSDQNLDYAEQKVAQAYRDAERYIDEKTTLESHIRGFYDDPWMDRDEAFDGYAQRQNEMQRHVTRLRAVDERLEDIQKKRAVFENAQDEAASYHSRMERISEKTDELSDVLCNAERMLSSSPDAEDGDAIRGSVRLCSNLLTQIAALIRDH